MEPESVSSNVVYSKWDLVEFSNDSTSDEDGAEDKSKFKQEKSKIDIKPILPTEDHKRQALRDVEVKSVYNTCIALICNIDLAFFASKLCMCICVNWL